MNPTPTREKLEALLERVHARGRRGAPVEPGPGIGRPLPAHLRDAPAGPGPSETQRRAATPAQAAVAVPLAPPARAPVSTPAAGKPAVAPSAPTHAAQVETLAEMPSAPPRREDSTPELIIEEPLGSEPPGLTGMETTTEVRLPEAASEPAPTPVLAESAPLTPRTTQALRSSPPAGGALEPEPIRPVAAILVGAAPIAHAVTQRATARAPSLGALFAKALGLRPR